VQYLVSVTDDTAGLATPGEMAAINAFTDQLKAASAGPKAHNGGTPRLLAKCGSAIEVPHKQQIEDPALAWVKRHAPPAIQTVCQPWRTALISATELVNAASART